MYTMDQIHHIRELFYQQDMSLAEIARVMNCDWRTVKKYVDQEDFSPQIPTPKSEKLRSSKLDPFKQIIDEWLTEDQKAPRKQRHTAKRVYRRLCNEATGFDASYRLVADYVSAKKKELHLSKQEGYIPLIHRPGEAQADLELQTFTRVKSSIKMVNIWSLVFPTAMEGIYS